MRKFFSILLSIILIISLCVAVSVPGSAVFVVDDVLLYSIGISVAASIALSCGIAVASGQDNAFSTGANALGQMVYESLQEQYSQAQLLSMVVIANGKAYFKSPESLYTRIKNFLQNYNFSNLKAQTDLTVSNVVEFGNSFVADSKYFAYGVMPSILTLNQGNSTIYYSPSSAFNFILNGDNTIFYYKDTYLNRTGYYGCISAFKPSSGVSFAGFVCNSANPPAPVNDLSKATQFYYNRSYQNYGNSHNLITNTNNSNNYIGLPGSDVKHHTTYSNSKVYLDGYPIFSGASQWDWSVKCILAGKLLVNIENNIDYNNDGVKDFPVNTDSSGSSIETPVDIVVSSPSIPDSEIGQDSSVMIPLPGNIVDPVNPDIPLTQTSVKNRIKRGQAVEFVPEIEKLNGVLPRDYPVLVTNTVTDTQVIDTPLSTTFIGDNSETFLVIPNNPGVVAVPDANDEPLVSYPYPDVINPGNETITVVNNPDVFPTRVPAETATAAPGETVAEITRVSEIVSEAVSDIVQPVTPEDIERGANKMKLSSQLLRKFPFCIPFDFYNAINQFSAPAETPVFDIPFHIQSINFDYNFHIDMSQFETAAKISRWFFSVSWVIILIFLTRKVIWK